MEHETIFHSNQLKSNHSFRFAIRSFYPLYRKSDLLCRSAIQLMQILGIWLMELLIIVVCMFHDLTKKSFSPNLRLCSPFHSKFIFHFGTAYCVIIIKIKNRNLFYVHFLWYSTVQQIENGKSIYVLRKMVAWGSSRNTHSICGRTKIPMPTLPTMYYSVAHFNYRLSSSWIYLARLKSILDCSFKWRHLLFILVLQYSNNEAEENEQEESHISDNRFWWWLWLSMYNVHICIWLLILVEYKFIRFFEILLYLLYKLYVWDMIRPQAHHTQNE